MGATKSKPECCAFLTDVEGNFEFFEGYVENSKVLSWGNQEHTSLKLRDNAMFVFGGDSQDKGAGDVRFVQAMLNLKENYPDRVFFIIGNRDANKLRLAAELHKDTLTNEAIKDDVAFPYWVPKEKVVTPAAFIKANKFEDTAATRLKWILKETMGADGAFERRRFELAIVKKKANSDISDDEVVQSYRDEVDPSKPENFMLRYLEKAQLAHKFGKVLFVHGGVSKENMGWVPGQDAACETVDEWVQKLNAWAQSEVDAFKGAPFVGANSKDRAGFGLMDYGVPKGNGGKTVVYESSLLGGNPAPLDKPVLEFLRKSKINTVVCGHVPHGDCPAVAASKDLRVITADTSYSKMGNQSPAGWGEDNRGPAVGEVLLWEDGSVDSYGILADGQKYEYHLAPPAYDPPPVGMRRGWVVNEGVKRSVSEVVVDYLMWRRTGRVEEVALDLFIGRKLKTDFWVKAKLKGQDSYQVCKGEGFKLVKEFKTAEELKRIGFADSHLPAPGGKLTVKVLKLEGAPEFTSYMDISDPYIVLDLYEEPPRRTVAGLASGSKTKTKVKVNAGGSAAFNEELTLTKTAGQAVLRVSLWDNNLVVADEELGAGIQHLDALFDGGDNNNKPVPVEVQLIRWEDSDDVHRQLGHPTGTVTLEVTLAADSPAAPSAP